MRLSNAQRQPVPGAIREAPRPAAEAHRPEDAPATRPRARAGPVPPRGRGLAIVLVAALAGAGLAFLTFMSEGPVPAVIAMPFGASLAALAAALALASRR